MATRSKQLCFISAPGTGTFTCYLVPDGFTTIIKDISVVNTGGGPNNWNVFIATAGGATFPILTETGIAPGDATQWTGWRVLNEGDKISANGPFADFNVWASGAELID